MITNLKTRTTPKADRCWQLRDTLAERVTTPHCQIGFMFAAVESFAAQIINKKRPVRRFTTDS
jgi:hypothetical protein